MPAGAEQPLPTRLGIQLCRLQAEQVPVALNKLPGREGCPLPPAPTPKRSPTGIPSRQQAVREHEAITNRFWRW